MTPGDDPSTMVPTRVERAISRGAEAATIALSRWLGRPAEVVVSRVRLTEIAETTEALGPSEDVVACCAISLSGPIPATVLMTFDDRSAMAMIDRLLGLPEGTSTSWGAMEKSAAQETANIVVCAFVNALAEEMGPGEPIVPGPPEFRIEFAGSLLQFALMDQAIMADRIVLVETRFSIDGVGHDWSMVIVPASGGLETLGVSPEVAGDDSAPGSDREAPL